jgi:DNA-binding MarR family transcriptional regulator
MEGSMGQDNLTSRFQQTMARLNTSRFVNDVAEYYQGESAMLSCIESLEQQGRIVNPSMLSERLDLARGTVTATLRSLERKGLAKARPMRDDRRRVQVQLTEKGRLQAQAKRDKVDQWCATIIASMGQQRFSTLVELIDLAIAGMGYEQEARL